MIPGTGLGVSVMGSVPFGAGTPATSRVPPADIADQANYLNPRTGDYVIAEDGSNQRMPIVRHQVLMLISTKRGSAAATPETGLELPAKMDQSFEQRARGAVLLALEPIGDDIRVDSIPIERVGTGRADIQIEYTDLTTGNAETITI